jgi:hypothetical protein
VDERIHSNCKIAIRRKADTAEAFCFSSVLADLPLKYIIYYLHPVSANLQFLQFNGRYLCTPSPLPSLSALLEETPKNLSVSMHPGQAVQEICYQLDMPSAALSVDPGFRLWVETPGKVLPLYLLKVNTVDLFSPPPLCHWIPLTECYGLPDIEREMLQHVYQFLLA